MVECGGVWWRTSALNTTRARAPCRRLSEGQSTESQSRLFFFFTIFRLPEKRNLFLELLAWQRELPQRSREFARVCIRHPQRARQEALNDEQEDTVELQAGTARYVALSRRAYAFRVRGAMSGRGLMTRARLLRRRGCRQVFVRRAVRQERVFRVPAAHDRRRLSYSDDSSRRLHR